MKPLQIVRIERNDTGIFQCGDTQVYNNTIARKTFDRHNGGNFPLPYYDRLEDSSSMELYLNLYKHEKEWFCAYKTIEQLQDWIYKDEIQYFISVGFELFLLNVSEYQIGQKQILFTKESIISKENISSLFI